MNTYDLLTIDEARNAIMASDQRNDEWLALMNTAIAQKIDQRYGPMVNRSITEYHDGGTSEILPRQRPLSSVTTLVEYRWTTGVTLTAETVGTAPSDAYLLRPDGAIMRRQGGWEWYFWPGRGNIALTYVAGRFASTAVVDEVVKQAAMITLFDIWRDMNGSGNTVFGADGVAATLTPWDLPRKAELLLMGYKRGWGIA